MMIRNHNWLCLFLQWIKNNKLLDELLNIKAKRNTKIKLSLHDVNYLFVREDVLCLCGCEGTRMQDVTLGK